MPRYEGQGRGFSLKDQLFNPQKTAVLAGWLEAGFPGFDRPAFEAQVGAKLPDLELKERIVHIADVLAEHLPKGFPEAAKVIQNCLPPRLDPSLTDDDFGDFIIAPYGHFVATRWDGHYDVAMETIRELTMRFSMEDAIRTFLKADEAKGLAYLDTWSRDNNYHVRRLVSEGTRPRLPWSGRLALPQAPILDILTRLHADKTRYVTRSVANHLNDIAKDAPQTVTDTLSKWHKAKSQSSKELDWITRHALRTLIKAGDPVALDLLGYAPNPPVDIALSLASADVKIGETVDIEARITAREKANVIIDYALGFRKANGSTQPKMFKLKTLKLKAGQAVTLTKRHRLDGDATTYKLYPGAHYVQLQINGAAGPRAEFMLH